MKFEFKSKFLAFLFTLVFLASGFINVDDALAKNKSKKRRVPPKREQEVEIQERDRHIPHNPDNNNRRAAQMRSIVKVFTETNPRLKHSDAKDYAEYILEACRRFKQEPFAVAALIVHESTVNKNAASRRGDYGLMQVRWNAHKHRIIKDYPAVKHAKDLFKPRENIFIGTEILSNYQGSGDLNSGIMRYSAGNRQLVRKVNGTMRKLENYYKKYL